MKLIIQFFFLLCFPLWLSAQATSGSTGLLNIPSAEMQADGIFMFGGNYLPENFTPEDFNYDTGNYYLNLTFLSFMEVTYRCTLFKTLSTGKYTQQDRTFGLRLQLFKEKKYWPAIVFGSNDLYSEESDGRNQHLGANYVVSSKNIDWYDNKLEITLGAGFKSYNGGQVQGPFGGVSISPSFLKQVSIIAEYDSKSVNVGATTLLFKHLYLHAFVHDFENIVGGFAYKIYLKGE